MTAEDLNSYQAELVEQPLSVSLGVPARCPVPTSSGPVLALINILKVAVPRAVGWAALGQGARPVDLGGHPPPRGLGNPVAGMCCPSTGTFASFPRLPEAGTAVGQ